MSQPIHVAQIMGRMMGGGVESTIMNHYKYLDHDKVQFDFIVQDDSENVPADIITESGGKIYTVPSYRHLLRYNRAFDTIFSEIHPDIVHSNMNALSVFPLAAAAHNHVPVRIAHSHSTANPQEIVRTTVKNVLRPMSKIYPTHLAACGKYSAEWLFGKQAVADGKVHYIHNAIELQKFSFNEESRQKLRKSIGVNDDQFVIGQVGRFSAQKNQTFSVEVFKEYLHIDPTAVLVFLGIGDTLEQVKKEVHDFGLDSHVHFMGLRDNTNEWYSAFDALLFPSLYEGLPLVAIEAQASGLPVLLSDQVTEEARIVTSLIEVESLKSSPRQWAYGLAQLKKRYNPYRRINTVTELANAGYDIRQSAADLQEWYIQLHTQENRNV